MAFSPPVQPDISVLLGRFPLSSVLLEHFAPSPSQLRHFVQLAHTMPTKAPPLKWKDVFRVVMAIIPQQKAQPNALVARSTATPLFSLPTMFQDVYVTQDMLW